MQRRPLLLGLAALPLSGRAAPDAGLMTLLGKRLEATSTPAGIALAVAQTEGMQLRQAALARGGAAPAEDALFEIGSITKTFTALLLADAVVRGELKLGDPVEAALPDGLKLRDNTGTPLQWLDLATQASGLPRLPVNLQPQDPTDPYADYGSEQLKRFVKDWQPSRPRQQRYEYSNLGFGLLGQALAWRGGKSYAALLTERVLTPLGLDEVYLSPPADRLLAGHDAKGQVLPHWHFTDAFAGAGALLASARGLARYGQAAVGAFEHPLAEAFSLCLRRQGAGLNAVNAIGLAWNLAPLNKRTVCNHDGATAGFSSTLWLDPAGKRSSLALASAQLPLMDLSLHLLDASLPLTDFSSTQQKAVKLDPQALEPLAGSYALNPNFKLRISARGEQLFVQATGQGEFEIHAKAPREFFARITPLAIRFDGDSGAPPALTLLQGGREMRFLRE